MSKEYSVNDRWTLLTKYVYFYSTWTLNIPDGRECQVGVGFKMGGKPRGERKRFTKYTGISTFGGGGIYVRSIDGKGPCKVRLDQGDVGRIPFPRIEFP